MLMGGDEPRAHAVEMGKDVEQSSVPQAEIGKLMESDSRRYAEIAKRAKISLD